MDSSCRIVSRSCALFTKFRHCRQNGRRSLSTSPANMHWLPAFQEGGRFAQYAMQIKNATGKLDVSKRTIVRAARTMYGCCTDPISHRQFIEQVHLPDTFASWFRITELHVWLCMVRLQVEGEEGRYMRNALVKQLWLDIDARSKLLGPEALMERKRSIQIHSDEFRATLFNYDEGLLSNDMVLAGALWRQFFSRDCEEPELIELIVNYVRLQVANLDMHAKNDLFTHGVVKWLPLRAVEAGSNPA